MDACMVHRPSCERVLSSRSSTRRAARPRTARSVLRARLRRLRARASARLRADRPSACGRHGRSGSGARRRREHSRASLSTRRGAACWATGSRIPNPVRLGWAGLPQLRQALASPAGQIRHDLGRTGQLDSGLGEDPPTTGPAPTAVERIADAAAHATHRPLVGPPRAGHRVKYPLDDFTLDAVRQSIEVFDGRHLACWIHAEPKLP
jgi:hypothetical protein